MRQEQLPQAKHTAEFLAEKMRERLKGAIVGAIVGAATGAMLGLLNLGHYLSASAWFGVGFAMVVGIGYIVYRKSHE
jgi:hypothetical protein